MRKLLWLLVAVAIVAAVLSCSRKEDKEDFGKRSISLISREEGSGTRGAFVELFGIEQKNSAGQKVDMTSEAADVTNSTEVMLTSVVGNKGAAGYVSLGSLGDSVKALKIDGTYPSVANIKTGSYKVSRPFNIVTKAAGVSDVAEDFIRFILSSDGQAVVESAGYIGAASNPRYVATGKKGKVTVGGSSSVTPVMEKLAEAYQKLSPAVNVEVQLSDSTTGINSAISGVCDIGMASRDLKDSEVERGVVQRAIATDGIAVIVNKANPIDGLASDAVRRLFMGEFATWADVQSLQ